MSFAPVVNMQAGLSVGDRVRFRLTFSSLFSESTASVAQIVDSVQGITVYSVEPDFLVPPLITSSWIVVVTVQAGGITPEMIAAGVQAAASDGWSRWEASVSKIEQEVIGLPSVEPSTKTAVTVASVAVIAVLLWWILR